MVWCIKNGTIYNTSFGVVLEPELMWELKKVSRDVKIVEDEFDERGRPKVKIVYMDPRGWSNNFVSENRRVYRFLMECEKKMIAKLNKNQALEAQVQPPRMIIATQDRDYWPGSENDPEAMRRRAIKEKAFAEISQGRHMGYVRPGYMLINVPPNLDDDYSDIDGRGPDFYDRSICQRFFDPSLPGTKFILDNYDQKELEDGFGGLDAIAEMMGWKYP